MMMSQWLGETIERRHTIVSRSYIGQAFSILLKSEKSNVFLNKPGLDGLISSSTITYKNGPATTVVPVSFNAESLILKRYNARSLLHVFSRALRQTRAMRCWKRSYDFAQAGINVALPCMMFEQRLGPVRLDAYFLCEKLDGEELLELLPTMSNVDQQSVLTQMKDAFKKMRAAKLTHGDMKATNIMWVDGELFFIDLDAARKHRFMSTWRRSHVKDVKRFIKNWKGQPQLLALFNELYDS